MTMAIIRSRKDGDRGSASGSRPRPFGLKQQGEHGQSVQRRLTPSPPLRTIDGIHTVQVGTRIGHYEVVNAIGSGGMGEVWKARDTRLRRDVAIKALPAALAQDPGRLARLEREAALLASVNHDHIATIHGLEEYGGTRVLVLELVEGTTLESRLVRGRLPVEQALTFARQLAEALTAAHDKGGVSGRRYDVAPDGRFLVTAGVESSLQSAAPVSVILNWLASVRQQTGR